MYPGGTSRPFTTQVTMYHGKHFYVALIKSDGYLPGDVVWGVRMDGDLADKHPLLVRALRQALGEALNVTSFPLEEPPDG